MSTVVVQSPSFSQLWDKLFAEEDGGLQKVIQTIARITAIVERSLAHIPAELNKFSETLKGPGILGVFSFISDIKYWICDHSSKISAIKTTAKVFATVGGVSEILNFLQHVGAVNFSALAGTLGGIPIFGTVVSAFALVVSGISLASKGVELHNAIAKVRTTQSTIDTLNQQIRSASADQLDDLKTRISTHTEELVEAKKERTKAWLAVAFDIAKIVLSILMLVGFIAGIVFLSATGIPLLIFAAALTIFGLSKFIYEEVHPKKQPVPTALPA